MATRLKRAAARPLVASRRAYMTCVQLARTNSGATITKVLLYQGRPMRAKEPTLAPSCMSVDPRQLTSLYFLLNLTPATVHILVYFL